jgi:antitoxin component YwqK of YwqJK toxin-antitoxin module
MKEIVRNYFKDSKNIESEGELKNGEKHGNWKYFHENGAIRCEGSAIEGKSEGEWRYYHKNGKLSSQGKFANGNKIGKWAWFTESGEPSTIGAFKDDKRFGVWTWMTASGMIKTRLTYNEKGYLDGLEQWFTDDGKILLKEINRVDGEIHGKVEKNDSKGNPLERATYFEGHLDGDHHIWENGKKKTKKYHLGIPELDEKKWKSLATKIKKKKGGYSKLNVLDDIVAYKSKERTIWYMFRHNYLDFDKESILWTEIDHDLSTVPVDDFVQLLKMLTLDSTRLEEMHKFLGFWPEVLDKICMHMYAKNPQAFDDVIHGLAENVKEGMQTIQVRFNRLDRSKINKNMTAELVKQHLHHYGLGTSVSGVDGFFDYVWWQDKGKVFEYSICENSIKRRPNDNFENFIETFTDLKEFKFLLLEEALKMDYNLSFQQAIWACEIASKKQFAQLYEVLSGDDEDYYWAFLELRKDSAQALEYIAKQVKEEHRVGSKSERAIIAAILKCVQEDKEIPAWYDEYIQFDGFNHGQISGGGYFNSIELVEEALSNLPIDRLKNIFKTHFTLNYGKDKCLPLLTLVEQDIWDEALAVSLKDLKKDTTISNRSNFYAGLARLEEKGIEWLYEKLLQHKDVLHLRETLDLAHIYLLSSLVDKGIEWDKKHDICFQINQWQPKYGDDYDHYIKQQFHKAFNSLSEERQIETLLPQIDGSKKTFIRVFSLFNENTPDVLLNKSMKELASNKVKSPGKNWFKMSISGDGKLVKKASDLVELALEGNVKGEPLTWMKDALGNENFEKLKKDLKEKGKKIAKEKSKFELLEEDCLDYFKDNPKAKRTKVYWLESDKDSSKKSLSRVGGLPLALESKEVPKLNEELMQHILTIDLNDVPEIAKGFDKETRAISLYLGEPDYNEAYKPYNNWTKVIELKEKDIEEKEFKNKNYKAYCEKHQINVLSIEVPSEIFVHDEYGDLELDDDLEEIKLRLYRAPGYIAGDAMWLQSPEHDGNFLMQFDEQLAPVNLGDTGIMYVFSDTVFWQCH